MTTKRSIRIGWSVLALVLAPGLFTADAAAATRSVVPNRGLPSAYHATLKHTAKTRGIVMNQATQERWSCGDTKCEGIRVRHLDVASCRVLAQAQGPVASFSYYDGARRTTRRLTPAQIRQCNGQGQQQGSPVVRSGTRPRVTVRAGKPLPDTLRTGTLVLVGKPQPLDTITTPTLVLVGKPQPQDTITTPTLVLVAKPQPADAIRTAPLILMGKPETQPVTDRIRTPTLILKGKKR